MNNSRRSGSFEREICTILSDWWIKGRDDIFWRTHGSGARATSRRKRGKGTYGQECDVCASDPIGAPLTELCVIELKLGRNQYSLADLLDCPARSKPQVYEEWISETIDKAERSGVPYWLVIVQRRMRERIVLLPSELYQEIQSCRKRKGKPGLQPFPMLSFSGVGRDRKGNRSRLEIMGMKLSIFLEFVSPAIVRKLAEEIND